MRQTLLRESIRRALTQAARIAAAPQSARSVSAFAALGLLAAPAFAQDAQDQNNQQLETITVTGSNIRRVDIETSNPVITIDRAAIQKTGKLTLGDLVQQLPAVTGPNTNPQVNNGGGTGFTSIGLRGLGSPRTLTLINGHRYLSGNPNDIPANMVERIEVLTDGASSVYGSDAVAGVVNFILRSDYQGAEFSVNYGISDKDDGQTTGYQFTFGKSSDKGSIMAGISYNKTEQVLAGHRDFSKNSVSLYGTTATPPHGILGGSTSSPFGHIQIPDGFANLFPGCTTGYLARNPGTSGLNVATDYHCYVNNATATTPSDKYNFATVNLIMTPQERTGLFLNGNYKLTDNIEVYAAIMHNKTASASQLAPAPVTKAHISADSYYNPFHADFGGSNLGFATRLVTLGNRTTGFGSSTDQVSTGLKGSFGIWNDQLWNWDVGFDYGHVSIATTVSGLPNLGIVNQAAGPSFLGTDGAVHCGTPDAPINGCTPINLFNLDDPNTIAVLRAAGAPASNNFFTQEKVWRGDMNGGLFELPAGTMQLAVGASYRKEYTHSNVDTSLQINPATGTCVLGSQCGSSLQGGYNVKDVYAELFIPVLKDIPFVHALNVTIGDRYSKYNNFGNTNNSKVALEWRPIEDLLLRGTVSEVFRAPTVANLFASAASNAPKLSNDPCDHYTGSPANPACVNVPTDGSFINQNVAQQLQITAIASGSQFAGFPLGPEFGKSFDWGIVYDPHFIEGLSVSADLWRLYLNNNITAVGAQSVLDLCSAGQSAYCPLIHRFATGPNQGQIDFINEPTGNLGRVDVKGVDFALNYRLPEFSFGRFNVGLNATYLEEYNISTAPGTPANTVYHYAGHFMTFGSAQAAGCPGAGGGVCLFPRWRAQSSVGWQLGAFDASWRMRYIGRFQMGSQSPSQDVFPAGTCYYGDYCTLHGYVIKYGATVYNDIQFGYNMEAWNSRLDFGVNNVADKQPPLLYSNNTANANTDPSDFDLMGRFYWGRITVKF
ncbi:MAG TPA: TonB-dependent receptor [Rhodanobacteraceae bacterium]|nr:TonB-dependent receptor [Rhodanobacteraceae bacterium]